METTRKLHDNDMLNVHDNYTSNTHTQCGDLLVGSFPFITALSLTDWTIVVSVFLIPCAFINSLRHVSTLRLRHHPQQRRCCVIPHCYDATHIITHLNVYAYTHGSLVMNQ